MNLLDQKLRLALFWMIGIGVQVYCIAESNTSLALIALPIWLLAWPMSMSARGRSVPKLVLGAIALGLTARVFAQAFSTPEDFVTNVSRYIVWLQLLKLYDKRDPGDIMQAMSLSVFLVLGGCLTSNSVWLGVGLLVYTPSALWGITIYQLYAEQQRVGATQRTAQPLTRKGISQLRRLGFVSGIASAAIAVVVFMFMPRGYGEGFLGDVGVIEPTSVSGVPDEIRLGDSGLINSSSLEVMEVKITDESGANIGESLMPVYFRATTLDEYANGSWRQSNRLSNTGNRGSRPNRDQPVVLRAVEPQTTRIEGEPVYIQNYKFLTRDRKRLFSMNRAIRLFPDSANSVRLRFNPHDVTFKNYSGVKLKSYTVWSQPDAPRIPPFPQLDWRYERQFVGSQAHTLAMELLDRARLVRDPELQRTEIDGVIATLFEGHLQRNYGYTLEMIAPEPGEDPIEMFLSRTKSGHCEYFASTMAAMLRSVGIDARVVTGYAATEFDDESGLFIIRESQAHAWVEARTEQNRWITYDPSPSADVITSHKNKGGLLTAAKSVFNWANAFWIDHIVGFDRTRQQAALGDQSSKIRGFFERIWPTPQEGAESDPQMQEIRTAGFKTLIGAAAQISGLVLGAFGLSVILILLLRKAGAYFEHRKKHRAMVSADPEHSIRQRQSAFFRRYLRLLRSAGLAPKESTPALTHAHSLREQSEPLARDGARITAIYYKLRFGRELLTSDELEEAEQLLTQIAGTLTGAR